MLAKAFEVSQASEARSGAPSSWCWSGRQDLGHTPADQKIVARFLNEFSIRGPSSIQSEIEGRTHTV